MTTLIEVIVLWILLCGIAVFLGAKKIVIVINSFIAFCIIGGFFIGIGIKLLNSMF